MPLEPSSNFTQASSWANDWETLFYFEVGIFIFFSVLIFSLILYFAIKYRRRPGNEAAPPTKDHLPLEVTWTVVPAAICNGCGRSSIRMEGVTLTNSTYPWAFR